ncbi:cytochrome c oxidase accessory protein CcoG [Arcobacter sp. 31_11_sub10_T18]|nr:cytochrome c oxidase accessory protein CcoG [Arcobacter sp. 31_11_sub10_T18]
MTRALLKNWIPYRYKRYYAFAAFTIISLVLPFIVINGNHFLLLSFDYFQFHLFFVKFDMQELYLIPILLMILFIGIFFITALGGRIWCGWMCPQTIFRIIFRDLIETKILGIRKRIKNKQKLPEEGQYFKKLIALILWTIISIMAAANFLWYFIPPEDFFVYLLNPLEHYLMYGILIGTVVFFVYITIKLKEDFCIYVCPYARIQSVMYDTETIQTIYNPLRGGKIYENETKIFNHKRDLIKVEENAECTLCDSCVKVCPTHIDIKKGPSQLECINCLECIDACTEVQSAFNRPSLISWSNEPANIEKRKPKFFRPRILVYAFVLFALTIGLFIAGSKKEFMLLNINRTTQLYKVKENRVVENAYTFLFQNTDNIDHTYYFRVVNNEKIKIKRPQKSFLLSAGKKVRKIVVLSTSELLAKNDRLDVALPVEIEAYAIDNKNKIKVLRSSTFIYPRFDKLSK